VKLIQSLRTNVTGIAIFAALTALLISGTFVLTKDAISSNIKEQASIKLYEIIGDTPFDNDVFSQTVTIDGNAFGYSQPIDAHVATLNGKVQTVIFPVLSKQGYSGDITLLLGINADTSIAGVRVVSHRETPGLGDKLELKKSPWLLSFNNQKKLNDKEWAVKKDGGQFDQFTGATITPRAVVNAVGDALDYFESNQQTLTKAVSKNN
jgi:electron transport complex protein RnfG